MAKEKGKKRKEFQRKMLYKYRVVIMNEDTLEEKASMRLNRLNIFVFGSLFAILMVVATTLIIIYTPLRQYILGFSEADMRQHIVELTFKSDSLENTLKKNDVYFASIQKVLRGDIKPDNINRDSIPLDNSRQNLEPLTLHPKKKNFV